LALPILDAPIVMIGSTYFRCTNRYDWLYLF